MGEFFVGMVALSLAVGILGFISFRSKGDKTTRTAMGIILMWVVSVSVFSGISRLSESDFDILFDTQTDSMPEGEHLKAAEEAFSDGIKMLLLERYEIKKEDSEVVIFNLNFEKMRAEKIEITLSGYGAFADFRSIENYIEEAELGECEVKIHID